MKIKIRGGGAAGRSDAVFIGEQQKTVIIDTAQRAVVLAAIAALLEDHQVAKADDAASMSSSNLLDSSVSSTPATHGSLPTPVDVSQGLDMHSAAEAFFATPAHVAAVADALPLLTVLLDLAKTPRHISKLEGNASTVATASTNASIAIEFSRGVGHGITRPCRSCPADIFVGGRAVEPAGAIVDITGDVLQVNNLAITIINTRATALQGDVTAGTFLNIVTDAGDNGGVFAPSIGYSINAMTIDASASGGLIMLGGDANFVPGASVALSTGDIIRGAANPVGYQTGDAGSLVLGNVLIGSIGNDTIISKSLTLPDYILTEGGADNITLAAGHTGADHVSFYAAAGNVNVGGKYAVGSVTGAIAEGGAGAFEFANPGWWGIPAGGSSANIETLFANGTGTSADNSTLTNFVPTQDFLDFSVKAWNTGTFVLGLISGFWCSRKCRTRCFWNRSRGTRHAGGSGRFHHRYRRKPHQLHRPITEHFPRC